MFVAFLFFSVAPWTSTTSDAESQAATRAPHVVRFSTAVATVTDPGISFFNRGMKQVGTIDNNHTKWPSYSVSRATDGILAA